MQQPDHRAGAEPLAIIVMGVSGCGKSTLGALLAGALDCPFLEGDDFHDAAAVAKMRAGTPLADEDRWPWLDRIGAAVKAGLASGGRTVAACSALRLAYRERLLAAIAAPTRFVLLDNSREELMRRLNNRPGHYMPASLLDSQMAILERPAPHESATAFDGGAAPEILRDAALAWLRSPAPRPAA